MTILTLYLMFAPVQKAGPDITPIVNPCSNPKKCEGYRWQRPVREYWGRGPRK